jgi:hypothetical protein
MTAAGAKYWEEWYGLRHSDNMGFGGNAIRRYELLYQRMEETEQAADTKIVHW